MPSRHSTGKVEHPSDGRERAAPPCHTLSPPAIHAQRRGSNAYFTYRNTENNVRGEGEGTTSRVALLGAIPHLWRVGRGVAVPQVGQPAKGWTKDRNIRAPSPPLHERLVSNILGGGSEGGKNAVQKSSWTQKISGASVGAESGQEQRGALCPY